MSTYRFNWNPASWSWIDLPERVREIAETGSTRFRWSTGRSKQPQLGDRVLILRVGSPPKGIVGAGTIVREPYLDRHWEAEKAAQGEQSSFVDIEFTRLDEQPFVGVDELSEPPFDQVGWFSQSPAVRVPDEVADR